MRAHERARESQRERECGGERELSTEVRESRRALLCVREKEGVCV